MIRANRFGTLLTSASLAIALAASAGMGGLACTTPMYRISDGMRWHPSQRVGVPDLEAEGWRRTSAQDADLAFYRPGAGIFAVRVRCPALSSLARPLLPRLARPSAPRRRGVATQ